MSNSVSASGLFHSFTNFYVTHLNADDPEDHGIESYIMLHIASRSFIAASNKQVSHSGFKKQTATFCRVPDMMEEGNVLITYADADLNVQDCTLRCLAEMECAAYSYHRNQTNAVCILHGNAENMQLNVNASDWSYLTTRSCSQVHKLRY